MSIAPLRPAGSYPLRLRVTRGLQPPAFGVAREPRDCRFCARPHVPGRRGVSPDMSASRTPTRPFAAIVDEHGPVVMRVVRALLGPADADDAWSETFLSALEAYPRLRPDSNVRGWLVTIAHHKAIDQLRGAGAATDAGRRPPRTRGGRRSPRREPPRARPRPVGRIGRPAVQATRCGRLPPPRGHAVRRDRRAHRQHRDRGPTFRGRRNRQPSQDLPKRSTHHEHRTRSSTT